jgi:hypothetical protein
VRLRPRSKVDCLLTRSCLSTGLIKRKQGDIQGSLQLFQAATCLNPQNVANLKQVARSLYVAEEKALWLFSQHFAACAKPSVLLSNRRIL